MDTDHQ